MAAASGYDLIESGDAAQAQAGAATMSQTAKDFASGKRDAKGEILGSKARCEDYFAQFQKEEPQGQIKMALAVFLRYCAKPLMFILIIYFKICKIGYKVYRMLPMNILSMVFGAALCFFGGVYFATIAAFEGFRQFGGAALYDEIMICWEEEVVPWWLWMRMLRLMQTRMA